MFPDIYRRGDLVMTTDLIEGSQGPYMFLHELQYSDSVKDTRVILIALDNKSYVSVSKRSLKKVGNILDIVELAEINS